MSEGKHCDNIWRNDTSSCDIKYVVCMCVTVNNIISVKKLNFILSSKNMPIIDINFGFLVWKASASN
jgi:hypothetical protein